MPGTYLYGWDSDAEAWVKLVCDANGKLKIDSTLILENPPVEDESKKAATSEWSFDHDADASAHHAKYTDANSRAAINDILNSSGQLTGILDCNSKTLKYLSSFNFGTVVVPLRVGVFYYYASVGQYQFFAKNAGGNYFPASLQVHNGTELKTVATEFVVDTKIEDHRLITNAHHDKYTDNDAQAAVNMVGNLYWSCAGIHFDANEPDIKDVTKSSVGFIIANADDISFRAQVNLPHGCTVTSVIVYGNVAAEAETWYFVRVHPIDKITADKANNNINSADNTITDPVIDNTNYSYFIRTTTLDTNDEIWGARITYIL